MLYRGTLSIMLGFLPYRWHEVLFSFFVDENNLWEFSHQLLFLTASALENINIKLCCLYSSESTLCCHVGFSQPTCIGRRQTNKEWCSFPNCMSIFVFLLHFNCPLFHLCWLSFWNSWWRKEFLPILNCWILRFRPGLPNSDCTALHKQAGFVFTGYKSKL